MKVTKDKTDKQIQKSETILIKISGASLKGNGSQIVSLEKIDVLVQQISQVFQNYDVAIVVGGGNIWRGQFGARFGLDNKHSDYVGMLSTIMNANLLHAVFKKHHLPSAVFSALHVDNISKPINFNSINEEVKRQICIFAGGIGEPFFTTDTVAVLRAVQINATKLLIGKNGVDGVYSSDPKKGGEPIFFEKLSYDYAVKNSLKIMDQTAFSLALEHNLEMIIFNIDSENSILNALRPGPQKTVINRKGE